MLEEYVDELIEEVYSILEMHQLQSNPLKRFSVQASLFSAAMTKLNEKIIDHSFQSIEEEISFFKNAKPKLLAEQHYSYSRVRSLRHCQNLSKEATEKHIKHELQRIDNFFLEHKDFCSYLSVEDRHLDQDYFTRLSKLPNPKVDYYLGAKDFRTTSKKGYIIGKIISKKRLSIYFQSQLKNDSPDKSSYIPNSIKKLNWNGTQTDFVELIYALKAAGYVNDSTLKISEVLSLVFGLDNVDAYKIWYKIKNRKINATLLTFNLLEALTKQIKEENEL